MTCLGDRHRVVVHDLKSWPQFFRDVVRGAKTVEMRLNDRNYHEGDILVLREWDPPSKGPCPSSEWGGRYTGSVVLAEVRHILVGSGPILAALPDGWIAMSIQVIVKREA